MQFFFFCEYCMYKTNAEPTICIKCKSMQFAGDGLPSEAKMRKALSDTGTKLPASWPYLDVVGVYQLELDCGTLDLSSNSFNFDFVKYPLEQPSVFLNNDDTLRNKIDTTMMDDISSFIVDENISPSRKSDFIAIMASLVIYLPSHLEKSR